MIAWREKLSKSNGWSHEKNNVGMMKKKILKNLAQWEKSGKKKDSPQHIEIGIMSEEDNKSEGCEVKENYNIFKKRNNQEVRKVKYEKEALNVRWKRMLGKGD